MRKFIGGCECLRCKGSAKICVGVSGCLYSVCTVCGGDYRKTDDVQNYFKSCLTARPEKPKKKKIQPAEQHPALPLANDQNEKQEAAQEIKEDARIAPAHKQEGPIVSEIKEQNENQEAEVDDTDHLSKSEIAEDSGGLWGALSVGLGILGSIFYIFRG